MTSSMVIGLMVSISLIQSCWGNYTTALPCTYCPKLEKVFCGKSFKLNCDGGTTCSAEEMEECENDSEKCDSLGYFPINAVTTIFYKCIINEKTGAIEKIIENCPNGTTYVDDVHKCLSDLEIEALKEVVSIKNSAGPFICKKPGVYPDVLDCKKYYVCRTNTDQGTQVTCSTGKFYNEDEGRCSFALSVGCSAKLSRKYALAQMESELLYWDVTQYMINYNSNNGSDPEDRNDDSNDGIKNDDLEKKKEAKARMLNGAKERQSYYYPSDPDSGSVFDYFGFSFLQINNDEDYSDETGSRSHPDWKVKSAMPENQPSLWQAEKGRAPVKVMHTRRPTKKKSQNLNESGIMQKKEYPCRREGRFKDPYNCHGYYECVKNPSEYDGYKRIFFYCQRRWFNPSTGRCEYLKPKGC